MGLAIGRFIRRTWLLWVILLVVWLAWAPITGAVQAGAQALQQPTPTATATSTPTSTPTDTPVPADTATPIPAVLTSTTTVLTGTTGLTDTIALTGTTTITSTTGFTDTTTVLTNTVVIDAPPTQTPWVVTATPTPQPTIMAGIEMSPTITPAPSGGKQSVPGPGLTAKAPWPASPEEAEATFGGAAYRWESLLDGEGWHLREETFRVDIDPSGYPLEGYYDRAEGSDARSFVTVDKKGIQGGSIWKSATPEEVFCAKYGADYKNIPYDEGKQNIEALGFVKPSVCPLPTP